MWDRMTKKDIREAKDFGWHVFTVSFGLANLLPDDMKIGYNAASAGWNWDAYMVAGCLLICGYRNIPKNVPQLPNEDALIAQLKNLPRRSYCTVTEAIRHSTDHLDWSKLQSNINR